MPEGHGIGGLPLPLPLARCARSWSVRMTGCWMKCVGNRPHGASDSHTALAIPQHNIWIGPVELFYPFIPMIGEPGVPRGSVIAKRLTGNFTQRLESPALRSEEHTSELQSRENLVCRLL